MSWISAITGALSHQGFSMQPDMVIEARKALEDNLMKALSPLAALGYQGPPTMSGEDLSPLILQSIDPVLAKATSYDESDYVFWKLVPKDQAKQTMHEIRREIFHGDRFLDLASAEGSAGTNDYSTLEKDFVEIKFWAARREMTNVAADLPSGGHLVNGSLLNYYTEKAMIQLGRRLEIDCLFGDSSMSALQTDGVIKQVVDAGRYLDLQGEQLTFDRIERKLGELINIDVGGHPTHFLVTPDVYYDLSIQAQSGKDRFDRTETINGRNFTFGSTGMTVFDPSASNRKIQVMKAPFLDIQRAYGSPFKKDGTTLYPAAGSSASRPPPDAITISSQPAAAASASTSKFLTDDAGTYYYHIMGVNGGGHTAAKATAAVVVAKGDRVTIKLDAAATTAPLYYFIFRSKKDEPGSTSKFLFQQKYVVDGGTGKIHILDDNALRPGCSHALLLNMEDKEEMAFYRLLPLTRIPLAKVELTVPFTVFMSGAMKVKVAEKQWIWKNVGVANPL